jgi:FtsH-binding integral membrane protein
MAYRFSSQYPYGPRPMAISTQSLLAQVLAITGLGLCLTALATYLFQNTVSPGMGLLAMLLGFVVLIAINATRANEALSLTLFYAFAFLEGIGIAPVVHQYVAAFGPGIVENAALTTGLGMFALAAIVYATGLDLRRVQGLVMLALLGLVLVGIVSIFVRFLSPDIYSWAVLAIFTVLVLIDFARLRAGGDGYTPVQLAVQIYLDAVNIFLAVLQLLGSRRSQD